MANPTHIVGLMQQSAFFASILGNLDTKHMAACAARFRPVHFSAGQLVFSRGDKGDALFLIEAGRLKLSVMTEDGRELSVRHATRGDVIGEIAMLDAGARTTDAIALTGTDAHILTRADFLAMIMAHPELSVGIIELLCRRLRDTTHQLEAIALHPIEVRLARFLLVALNGETAPPGQRVPLELGFSQTELAQLLGASRPKINSALRRLEENGAVRRTSDRLFCAPDLLAQLAGNLSDA